MRRRILTLGVLFAAAALPAPAQAADEPWEYRIEEASAELSGTQAGAHADFTVGLRLSEQENGEPFSPTRDIVVELPPGIVGNPQAFPKCTQLQFGTTPAENDCPIDSQVGSTDIQVAEAGNIPDEPIYNLTAASGAAARFGFFAAGLPVILNVRYNPATNSLVAAAEGASSGAGLISAVNTFWGVPADDSHDAERITPQEALDKSGPPGGRPSSLPPTPFMTNPTSCEARQVTITARSYQLPDQPSVKTVPFPQITGCGALEFKPTTALAMTTSQGSSGSGLDYELTMPQTGLQVENLNSGSHLNRAEVILPQGVTINPSQAEGLGVCSQAELARETFAAIPNQGCPETSKIGSVVAESPVIDRKAEGSLYVAKPYENPFGSLLALYMVLKIPDRGVLVRLAGKVTLDPATGQITTVFEDLPQLPVSSFKLHFREGARSPLVTPAACGPYTAVSNLSPWSNPATTVAKLNDFTIDSGPEHGPCPGGGLPPFAPGLVAGPTSHRAGAFSPFDLRLSRRDSEQEITHFSVKLPPGLVAKLAGVESCSDLAIAAAAARTGANGGAEELANPSCPAGSEIGRTLVGVGVGQVLTYVPGKVYLAGSYHGAPLSIVAITAAKAGPFDLGTVVVREALRVNPETAEVFVDATDSDPIPHIIQGIPTHLRDIRVYVDRPGFVLNPTDCSPTSVASTVMGAGVDFASAADDRPVTVSTRFQAADCGALEFKPRLRIDLKGPTKRSGNPALRAELRMSSGEANVGRAQVTLPHSEFLDQGHIGTICTRPQFNAGPVPGAGCPKASVYGSARAFTPLLDQPLEGPVYLRANGGERELPDLVAALNGQQIDVALVGYIDSVDGRIRTTFATAPDAPVSRFVLSMFGGKKSLLENSTDICRGKHRAIARFEGQNGKRHSFQPALRAKCPGAGGKSGKKRR
jgi:hypothetical protein